MPLIDHVPKDFAEGIINSCYVMKWDICKLMYHCYYFDAAMGSTYTPSTSATLLTGPIGRFAVSHPRMYRDLKLPSLKTGTLARDLELTRRVVGVLGGKVPILATIYSPAYMARNLYGGPKYPDFFLNAVKYSPDDVHKGLEILSEALMLFLDALLKIGIDGVFYAEPFASLDDMDKETHDEFGAKYDLPILNAIKDKTWFNMLHVHGYKNLRFSEYELWKYPVHA
jgi:uroporphyrinogen decarboxylase